MTDEEAVPARFAICIRDEAWPASLEARKLYDVVPDPLAERHGMIRVVDESGEDYLYPKSYFLELAPEVSSTVEQALRRAS